MSSSSISSPVTLVVQTTSEALKIVIRNIPFETKSRVLVEQKLISEYRYLMLIHMSQQQKGHESYENENKNMNNHVNKNINNHVNLDTNLFGIHYEMINHLCKNGNQVMTLMFLRILSNFQNSLQTGSPVGPWASLLDDMVKNLKFLKEKEMEETQENQENQDEKIIKNTLSL